MAKARRRSKYILRSRRKRTVLRERARLKKRSNWIIRRTKDLLSVMRLLRREEGAVNERARSHHMVKLLRTFRAINRARNEARPNE